MCGGTRRRFARYHSPGGLSPRVRGNQVKGGIVSGEFGSIPACAGEPPFRVDEEGISRVYPRVCGGTDANDANASSSSGLSPRVRGNLKAWQRRWGRKGSIPACAGEPRQGRPPRRHGRVYPRVCGGTISPPSPSPPGVYPRVCGGTATSTNQGKYVGGLSPRVRGNLQAAQRQGVRHRSIPACAGEPARPWTCRPTSPVYPRVCGGTLSGAAVRRCPRGLSPRVRGNRCLRRRELAACRSIPACAGEPRQGEGYGDQVEVYPRVCGGTKSSSKWFAQRGGLSPRVRGNRRLERPPEQR